MSVARHPILSLLSVLLGLGACAAPEPGQEDSPIDDPAPGAASESELRTPRSCQEFHAYFKWGIREDLQAAVGAGASYSLKIPGAVEMNAGYGVENVRLGLKAVIDGPGSFLEPTACGDLTMSLFGYRYGGFETTAANVERSFSAAKAIFDAMTRAHRTLAQEGTERVETRSTRLGLVRCERRLSSEGEGYNCRFNGLLHASVYSMSPCL